MVMTKIDDAPFTEEEKREIKRMGFERADWGHPDVVLSNPIEHFQRIHKVLTGPAPDGDFEQDKGPVALVPEDG